MEREDALDLLALLVERSLAFQEKTETTVSMSSQSDAASDGPSNREDPGLEMSPSLSPSQDVCIDVLREISKEHVDKTGDKTTHEDRMKFLDNLEHSHTYAMEMKQAALSASTWLTAIGRTGKTPTTAEIQYQSSSSNYIAEENMTQLEATKLRSLVQAAHMQLAEKDDLNDRLDRELSICRAEIGRLNTNMSRNEVSSCHINFIRIIAILLTVIISVQSSFLSPDKSILDTDVEDDSSASSAASSRNEFPETDNSEIDISMNSASQIVQVKNQNPVADAKKEIFLLKAELEEANRMLKNMERDIKWPTALRDQTNDGIEDGSRNETNDDNAPPSNSNESTATEVQEPNKPTGYEQSTSLLMDALKEDLEDYVESAREADKEEIEALKNKLEHFERSKMSTANSDEKMINVRMNAENFVTEWDKLGALPPPPDHDLRSPIVSDLLSQWTTDTETQESLLVWVEKIVHGQEPTNIPPLQLSGLDHQVRDGFTMHILPFLLRRSDIHVEVTTRAHRKTSYDVSVTISGSQALQTGSISFGNQQRSISNKSQMNLTSKSPHMMAFKASGGGTVDNSVDTPDAGEKRGFRGYMASALETGSVAHSAITTPASNRIINPSQLNRLVRNENRSTPVHEEGYAANDIKTSNDQTPQQQGGIMAGALNVMGGLLSRRKTPNQNDSGSSKKHSMTSPGISLSAQIEDSTNDLQEENQPYHRVVSAPPGRIGMTFVQYRGHAMVSDVYKDSPLAGWVFPSDILIAIDEVPVSGMRVPEIVKLLTARKESQRALRVISSHAMTELLITENSAALMDG